MISLTPTRWFAPKRASSVRYSDTNILLGRDGRKVRKLPGTEHVVLHARTGSGKTSNFVIPNCFAWPGSMVVLDIKGEIYNTTAGHRYHRLGQEVYRFDPTAEDGTHRWNSLDVVDRGDISRFAAIVRQSYLLFREQPGRATNADTFWIPAARQAFIAIARLLAETPGEPLTMANVLRILTSGNYFVWMRDKIKYRRGLGRPYSELTVRGVVDFLSTHHEQMMEAIRKSVTTILQDYDNPIIAAATASSDFRLADLRRRPMSIYVTVSPGNMLQMHSVLQLFFDSVVYENSVTTPQQDPSLSVPVLLVLDEFARLGRVDTLAQSLQYLRGYGVRIAMVVQNKAQIRSIYGPNLAADIFDNVGAEIVFGTGDVELAQELEKRLGDQTVLFGTVSQPRYFARFNWRRQSIANHPHRRPLALDQEILRMHPSQQLILRPGMMPMKTGRLVWFEDPELRDLMLPPPIAPRLSVTVPDDTGAIPLPTPPKN